MVFHYLLGLVDLLAALTLVALWLGYPLPQLQAGMALFLALKGCMFIGNFLSLIDIIIAISMFVLMWYVAPTFALCLALWLFFKGAYTFV